MLFRWVCDDHRDLATLRIIKIVKILRLIKLMRMFRISKLFSKWESALEVDYRWLSLSKFVAVFLLAAHWMACMWHMVWLNLHWSAIELSIQLGSVYNYHCADHSVTTGQ